jgi:gamma-glutamylcysteine synthetase
MSKILMGIIAAMGVGGYLYYQTAIVPMKNKLEEQTAVILAQDLRDQEQKATIVAIQETMEKTAKASANLQKQNQQYETQMTDYLDIFRRHNIAQLASAKPGLMTTRANKATEKVFNEIEDISKRINALND